MLGTGRVWRRRDLAVDRGPLAGADAEEKAEAGGARCVGWLTPYRKRGDRHTHIDLAELPEAMRRAGRPGPKPKRER